MAALLRELLAAVRPPHAPPQPLLVDLRGFAALLGVGESTLERLKATPQIGPQPVKLGGSLRWKRAEVEAWVGRRNHRGDLHDAKTWPAVWRQLRAV